MLIGLHMIMEQIIDLRDDVRQKQTLHEQCNLVMGREKAKGAPSDLSKTAYDKAKKALAAGRKKKKGKQPTTAKELKELTATLNDAYRMWQSHLGGTDDVKKATEALKEHLEKSLQNCRISARPGSAVWFGKVRASSAMTMDKLHDGPDANGDKNRMLHRCMNIGLSDEMLPDAALATRELEAGVSWGSTTRWKKCSSGCPIIVGQTSATLNMIQSHLEQPK